MNKDYVIYDNDGYNWVSLSKQLSEYTQEELAEHLIQNKKMYGTTQKVRLGGRIGAILNTDGCITKEDFLDKYHEILDKAGFKKESDLKQVKPIEKEEIKKESKPATKKEELKSVTKKEELKMDTKKEIKKAVIEKTPKIEEKKESKTVKKTKKPEIKMITLPFGMVSYTQEDLAHIVMDNKLDGEELGIKLPSGAVLDSVGCKTVEDFIKKNEKVATNHGIKHKLEEQLKNVNFNQSLKSTKMNMDDLLRVKPKVTIEKENAKKNEKVKEELKPIQKEEKPIEKEELKEELPSFEHVDDTPIVPLFQKMLKHKDKNNKDIIVNYKGKEISTEGTNSLQEIVDKYSSIILDTINNERDAIFKDVEIQKAKLLFEIPRGNYYNGREESEQPKLKIIHDKNNEYARIIAEREKIDFNDSKATYEWLNKLVPYINNHALNLNLGINVTTDTADKFLLKVMKEKGYNTNLVDASNMENPYRYGITNMLNELETYHFFISDYADLSDNDKDLTSPKTYAMVEVKYLENKLEIGRKVIGKIEHNMSENRTEANEKKENIRKIIKTIDMALIKKGDNSFDSKIETEEEKKAVEAYKLATVVDDLEDLKTAMELINNLPDNSKIKQDLNSRAYHMFDIKQDDKSNKKELDSATLNEIEKRNKCFDSINDIDETLNQHIQELENKKEKAIRLTSLTSNKINSIKEEYNLKDKSFSKDDDSFDFSIEAQPEKVGLFDKIKNSLKKNDEKQNEPESSFDFSLNNEEEKDELVEETVPQKEFVINEDDFDFSLSDKEDSLNKFVAIKSIKKISKTLYDKITNINIKKIIRKAVDKLRINKKAALIYASFAAVIVVSATAAASFGKNSTSVSASTGVSFESLIDNDSTDNNSLVGNSINQVLQEEKTNIETEKPEIKEEKVEVKNDEIIGTQSPVESFEILNNIDLNQASTDALSHVLDGGTNVYGSFTDASNSVNSIDTNKLYAPSWENAQGGAYYKEEDGRRTQISNEEAEQLFQDGEKIVQMIENDGVPIGFVNVDASGRTM